MRQVIGAAHTVMFRGLFADICISMPELRFSFSETRHDERRAGVRYSVDMPVEVRLAPPPGRDNAVYTLRNPFRPGTLKEIGAGGICFITGIPFGDGSTVELRLVDGDRPHSFKAVVRHMEQDAVSARTVFAVGAQIVRSPESEAVLPVLIDRATRVVR